MPHVLLGLGSNVGDRLENLRVALEKLTCTLDVLKVASVYETAPMYVTEQPAFYNSAMLGSSDMYPIELLRRLKEIERSVGREDGPRYGPREIDIDLLAYGVLAYQFRDKGSVPEGHLQVPHPKIVERRFVLEPLNEISPDFSLSGLGTVSALLARTNEQASSVNKLDYALLPVLSNR